MVAMVTRDKNGCISLFHAFSMNKMPLSRVGIHADTMKTCIGFIPIQMYNSA